jgi:hypothetical protein
MPVTIIHGREGKMPKIMGLGTHPRHNKAFVKKRMKINR